MTKIAPALSGLAAAAALGLNLAPAQAASKLWVSSAGLDSTSCGAITSPCATFQRAHNNAAAGGEIGVLNPGDYGMVSITKSISIINDGGGEAAIQASSSTEAVTVDSGGIVVQLRGLTIDGGGGSGGGIFFLMGSSLLVQNCVIKNFGSGSLGGIVFAVQSADTRNLVVTDTTIANVASTNGAVFVVSYNGGIENALLERVVLTGNYMGINAVYGTTPVNLTVADSAVYGNTYGIYANGLSGPVVAVVERSRIANNNYGVLVVGPGATLALNNSIVTGNAYGLRPTSGAVIGSYGNNVVYKNTTDVAPTPFTLQ